MNLMMKQELILQKTLFLYMIQLVIFMVIKVHQLDPVVAFLGTSSVTYESPDMGPISGITSQTNPADGVGTFGQIAIPSGTTSIDVLVMTGGGGQGVKAGGPGGNVQGTISNPSMAGQTWDYVVGEGGGGESSDPDHFGTHFGGFGGGGGGFYGSGGGFSGIFAGEVTFQEGGSYGRYK